VRDTFQRHLLAGSGDGDGDSDGEGDGDGPVNQTHWRDGLRIIALDSTIPGESHGALDDQTLDYLRAEIAAAAPDGTVLALHHPPIPSPIQPMAQIALREPERLRDAIVGSDVRIVLCGHNHHEALGTLGPVPVWVCPATAYRADVTSTQTFKRVPDIALSRIDLSDDGPTATVITVPAP
jgi:3',5'-cyclic-AMP phosphodiesterase